MQHRDIIGRNVRFREASVQLAELNDMDEVVAALERVFREDRLPGAEVRLRRAFLNRRPEAVPANGRADDELTVWRWCRDGFVPSTAWEIAIPLLGTDDYRLGSLVIWEPGDSNRYSISHLQMISGPLRHELQRKLHALGWTAPVMIDPSQDDGTFGSGDRGAVLTGTEGRPKVVTANAG
jgi:hypothetical protein